MENISYFERYKIYRLTIDLFYDYAPNAPDSFRQWFYDRHYQVSGMAQTWIHDLIGKGYSPRDIFNTRLENCIS